MKYKLVFLFALSVSSRSYPASCLETREVLDLLSKTSENNSFLRLLNSMARHSVNVETLELLLKRGPRSFQIFIFSGPYDCIFSAAAQKNSNFLETHVTVNQTGLGLGPFLFFAASYIATVTNQTLRSSENPSPMAKKVWETFVSDGLASRQYFKDSELGSETMHFVLDSHKIRENKAMMDFFEKKFEGQLAN